MNILVIRREFKLFLKGWYGFGGVCERSGGRLVLKRRCEVNNRLLVLRSNFSSLEGGCRGEKRFDLISERDSKGSRGISLDKLFTNVSEDSASELSELVIHSLEDRNFRLQVLEIFQKQNTSRSIEKLFLRYYTNLMTSLICDESPQLIDIHLEILRYGLKPSNEEYSRLLSLGTTVNESYLPVILELYSIIPDGIADDEGNLVDKLFLKWIDLKVPIENVLPIINYSLKINRFPSKMETYPRIHRILDDANIDPNKVNSDFIKAFIEYLNRKGPLEVPDPFFILIIQRSGLLGDNYKLKEEIEEDECLGNDLIISPEVTPSITHVKTIPPIIDLIYKTCEPFFTRKRASIKDKREARRKLIKGSFWEAVLDSYPTIPVDTIIQYLNEKGITLTAPLLSRGILKRQTDSFDCKNLIEILIKSSSPCNDDIDEYNCQLLRLISKEYSKSNPQYVLNQYDYYNEDRNIRKRQKENTFIPCHYPPFIHSIMYGAIESASYEFSIQVYKKFSHYVIEDEIAKNLYISALARSGQVKLAWKHVGRMVYHNMTINQETILSIVFEVISSGRRLNHMKKEKFTIEEIVYYLNALDDFGYKFPLKYCERLFSEINNLAYSYKEVNELLLALSKIYTKKKPVIKVYNRPVDFKNDRIIDIVRNKGKPTQMFTDQAVTQIIYWGFSKNPSKPWTSIQLLHELSKNNIQIPRKPVVETLADIISKVYGKLPAKGVYKRLRQQVDPTINVDMLVKNCNSAWKGESIGGS